ncbi:hypothetical protein BHM03_00043633 [Ensete ventricosum]|nr:hypothetical protein BHM03_00043633 [Ensete ventricosum]
MQVSGSLDRERADLKSNLGGYSNKSYTVQNSSDTQDEEKVPKVSPPRRKLTRDEKPERQNWSKKESGPRLPPSSQKQQHIFDSASDTVSKQYEQEASCNDEEINALLEEEDDLIAAHRKEIENTMEIVREEMNLLAEVDQPGSLIDNYVTQLSFVLSRKAAGLVSLQARLARFQQRLKEQEILSRKKGPK